MAKNPTSFSIPTSLMPSLSPEMTDRSRKNHTKILNKLASVGQETVASDIGVHESTVSRMKGSGELERFAAILACLDLKVVPAEYKCVDPKTLETILHGHRMWISSIESHEQLMWDD